MATASSSVDRHGGHWFPSWFIWPLFFLTSALRVQYVMRPSNWWILHPDEIYQTMEVAHSEVYGYGFRAYEFNPPPEVTSNTPQVRKEEQRHGLSAMRSYLLPHVYVTVTWLLQRLGLHFPPFVTWKVAHTLVASTLVLAVYRYVKVVFRSHDTACLAAVLCAACAQLHVLGTHTLVNSLLAPPVFLALAHLHSLVNPPPAEADNMHSDDTTTSSSSRTTTVNGSAVKPHGPSTQRSHAAGRSKGKQKPNRNGRAANKEFFPPADEVQNGAPANGSPAVQDLRAISGRAEGSTAGTENGGTENGHGASSNGLSSCSGTRPSVNAHGRAVQNGSGVHHFDAKADAGRRSTDRVCSGVHVKRLALNLAAGAAMGVCVYVRVDVAALALASLLPRWDPFRTRYSDVIMSACGALCGVGVGVFEDFRCYGWGVLTPYNWFRFNVQKDYASVLFGSNASHQYIVDIFLQNVGMAALTVVSFLCFVFNVLWRNLSQKEIYSNSEGALDLSCQSAVFRTSISWLLLLVLYSCKGHKEMRFVHNVIVLMLVTCAAFIQLTLRRTSWLNRETQRWVLVVGVALFVLSQWQDVASLTDSSKRGGNKMAFKEAGDTQHVNHCLYRLSSLPDLTGVFIDRNLYATGGYTLLHRDVPVFSIFGKNFHEYLVEDRISEPAKTSVGPRSNISVAYVGKFSNYVTLHNSRYVMKFVLEDARYNYLLVLSKHDFKHFGLGDPVFTCGMYKVYHRSSSPSSHQIQLLQQAVNAAPLTNASVLLHEADMLFYHGAWARAAERFHLALRVDPSQVGAYLPLAASYYRLGNTASSIETMNECYEKFGKQSCETRRPLMTSVSSGYD